MKKTPNLIAGLTLTPSTWDGRIDWRAFDNNLAEAAVNAITDPTYHEPPDPPKPLHDAEC